MKRKRHFFTFSLPEEEPAVTYRRGETETLQSGRKVWRGACVDIPEGPMTYIKVCPSKIE